MSSTEIGTLCQHPPLHTHSERKQSICLSMFWDLPYHTYLTRMSGLGSRRWQNKKKKKQDAKGWNVAVYFFISRFCPLDTFLVSLPVMLRVTGLSYRCSFHDQSPLPPFIASLTSVNMSEIALFKLSILSAFSV